MKSLRRLKPRHFWIALFVVWTLMLTGVTKPITGSSGILQLWQLHQMLSAKQKQVESLERQIAQLEDEKSRLEKSSVAQEREIRRVLGYAASDEIIFDFAAPAR